MPALRRRHLPVVSRSLRTDWPLRLAVEQKWDSIMSTDLQDSWGPEKIETYVYLLRWTSFVLMNAEHRRGSFFIFSFSF